MVGSFVLIPGFLLVRGMQRRRAAFWIATNQKPYYLVRRVRTAGPCRFQRRQLFLRDPLRQADLAREERGDGGWSSDFDEMLLARRDERAFTLDA